MDRSVEKLFGLWQKRNISGFFCEDKRSANAKIMELIPGSASIGFSGSQTLEQLEILKALEARGNKVFNQNKPGLSRQESLSLRRQGAGAEYYLASANAIASSGELVFLSAYGNRTAGIAYAENVIIVCGMNKISESLAEAVKRAREYATPLNCKRLNWNSPCFEEGTCNQEKCSFPEYKRMCCQMLIIEAEILPERFKVVLVRGSLGY